MICGENEILVAMASDMKITKYESESDAQYTQRVLYSALACWIKAATLDRDMSEPSASGASKKHIKEKCTQILEAALDRIPEARGYFYPEDASYEFCYHSTEKGLYKMGILLTLDLIRI